ncbi:hypothetical protein ACT3CD_14750 [Geofilum sp. OHC36d9]|uniref:hypothetical protein n=1 Tax=Geofilum sp. OHC36d9 TaxID=3458413 RepID=UPI004033A688
MRTLYQKFETLLHNTTTDFKRYLYENVSWDSRMVGIIGARGVRKVGRIPKRLLPSTVVWNNSLKSK